MTVEVIEDRWGLRSGTKANLATVNPIPFNREAMLESDTGRIKVGNGVDAWLDLQYINLGFIDLAGLSDGYVPTWDGANNRFKMTAPPGGGGTGGGIDPDTGIDEVWDFVREGLKTFTGSNLSFVTNSNAPAAYLNGADTAAALLDSEPDAPGIVRLSTGSTSSGSARLFVTPGARIKLGDGTVVHTSRIRIPTLSTSAQRFGILSGLASSTGAALRRLQAFYEDDINGGQWVLRATDGSGSTDANSVIAPVANTWSKLRIEVNAAGTSASLYVDGVLACTVAANIPTDSLGAGVWIGKVVGASSLNCDVDLVRHTHTFAATR